jgi:hypothetical protein
MRLYHRIPSAISRCYENTHNTRGMTRLGASQSLHSREELRKKSVGDRGFDVVFEPAWHFDPSPHKNTRPIESLWQDRHIPGVIGLAGTSFILHIRAMSRILCILFISLASLVVDSGGNPGALGKQIQATAFLHLPCRPWQRVDIYRGSKLRCCAPFSPEQRAASVRQRGSAQLPMRMTRQHEMVDYFSSTTSSLDSDELYENSISYDADWEPWNEVELGHFVARNARVDLKTHDIRHNRPSRSSEDSDGEDVVLSELVLKSDKFINGYSLGSVPRVARRAPTPKREDPSVPYPDVVSPDGMIVADFMVKRRAQRGWGAYSEAEEGRRMGGRAFYKYDPAAIARYYDRRPLAVLVRLVEAGLPLGLWAASVLWDKITNRLEQNQALRAKEIREVLSRTGPTTVKFGQALSNRPDVVGPVYIEELQQLQDNVGCL